MEKINIKLQGKIGVYMLMNLVNGKRYVGSSKNLYNRLSEHKHLLKHNRSHNAHLQAAWNKYGEDNFIYNVLEICNTEEEQYKREQYYIDTIKPEYNLSLEVIANIGREVTEETRQKISNTLKERYQKGEIKTYKQDHAWKKVWVYDINTYKLVGIYKNKAEFGRIINDSSSHILEYKIMRNKYITLLHELTDQNELRNCINKYYYRTNSPQYHYILTEENGELKYHKTIKDSALALGISRKKLEKNIKSTKNDPYIVNNVKFFTSNEFIKIDYPAVPIEKSLGVLEGKNGETPVKGKHRGKQNK